MEKLKTKGKKGRTQISDGARGSKQNLHPSTQNISKCPNGVLLSQLEVVVNSEEGWLQLWLCPQ